MPLIQETYDLQLRVLDLEARIEHHDARLQAQGELLERICAFLRTAHGEALPDLFVGVEQAAEEALRP
jgi:hypothetical protein